MKTRLLAAAAVAVLLVPTAAPGQTPSVARGAARGTAPFTTRRPAVRAPEPPRAEWRTPPVSEPGTDLFRASPWTYRPRYDRLAHRHGPKHLFFPGSLGFAAPAYVSWPPSPAPHHDGPESSTEDEPLVRVRPAAEPLRPQAYEPGLPGPAKTLYVIRGCYAGDVPPRADTLPDGCDPAAVRAILPQLR